MENLIVELTEIDIFKYLELSDIRKVCEKIVSKSNVNEEYSNLKIKTLQEAMMLNEKLKLKTEKKTKKMATGNLLDIYNLARENKKHTYEVLKKEGYIKNPVVEFLKAK